LEVVRELVNRLTGSRLPRIIEPYGRPAFVEK
jgi:hypothetical protein